MGYTDTSEGGLERLICTALTGDRCDPPRGETTGEPPASYGGAGWVPGNPHDYDREYCVDTVQLNSFLSETQPEIADALRLTTMARYGASSWHDLRARSANAA